MEPRKSRRRGQSSSHQLSGNNNQTPSKCPMYVNYYNKWMLLTDNNSAFLDKLFKVREKVKSSCQPLEAITTPQTPNLPVVETYKSPQLTSKKTRNRKFSKPAQKRCKRDPAVVRAGMKHKRPNPVNPGIKSAWSATALLTIGSVYHSVTGAAPSNVIEEQHNTSNFKQVPVGMDVFCDMLYLILFNYKHSLIRTMSNMQGRCYAESNDTAMWTCLLS